MLVLHVAFHHASAYTFQIIPTASAHPASDLHTPVHPRMHMCVCVCLSIAHKSGGPTPRKHTGSTWLQNRYGGPCGGRRLADWWGVLCVSQRTNVFIALLSGLVVCVCACACSGLRVFKGYLEMCTFERKRNIADRERERKRIYYLKIFFVVMRHRQKA